MIGGRFNRLALMLTLASAVPACTGTITLPEGAKETGGTGGASASPAWPTRDSVVTVDQADEFTGNLSGLSYEPGADGQPDLMWAVRNSPSRLYRLTPQGGLWAAAVDGDWADGKDLRFPDGVGEPDAEGLTRAEWTSSAIYVAAERANAVGSPSRLSVLQFDVAEPQSPLIATREWNLTLDLPEVDFNLGLEGITWVPDAFLVANQFNDENAAAPYDPARYPDHGTGLFFLGLESNGTLYAYALDHRTGFFTRVATIDSGQLSVVEVTFDRDTGGLWAYCDVTCHNHAAVLTIGTDGRFAPRAFFNAPAGLPDANNEGFALASSSSCAAGMKKVWWADDDNSDEHSLRQGTLPCAPVW